MQTKHLKPLLSEFAVVMHISTDSFHLSEVARMHKNIAYANVLYGSTPTSLVLFRSFAFFVPAHRRLHHPLLVVPCLISIAETV